MVRLRRFGLAVSCIAVVLIAVCASAVSDGRESAPRFTAKTTSGETFTNASVKGKVVLLEFWATWCPYCRNEEALLDDLHREFASEGLIVLAINVGESKKTVKQYLAGHPRSCRIVLMEDTNLAAMYQANSYPIYVLIDRDGNIAGEQRGARGERALRVLLAKAGIAAQAE